MSHNANTILLENIIDGAITDKKAKIFYQSITGKDLDCEAEVEPDCEDTEPIPGEDPKEDAGPPASADWGNE